MIPHSQSVQGVSSFNFFKKRPKNLFFLLTFFALLGILSSLIRFAPRPSPQNEFGQGNSQRTEAGAE